MMKKEEEGMVYINRWNKYWDFGKCGLPSSAFENSSNDIRRPLQDF